MVYVVPGKATLGLAGTVERKIQRSMVVHVIPKVHSFVSKIAAGKSFEAVEVSFPTQILVKILQVAGGNTSRIDQVGSIMFYSPERPLSGQQVVSEKMAADQFGGCFMEWHGISYTNKIRLYIAGSAGDSIWAFMAYELLEEPISPLPAPTPRIWWS